jgi:hypothetical protein
LAASLIALGVGLALIPTACTAAASADPDDTVQNDSAAASAPAPDSEDASTAAVSACAQFADALDAAATYYGNFADAIEGDQNPDYSDPYISTSNETGRTALRQAAAAALSASATPGLQQDIADPMQLWSADTTLLLVKMALHGGGDGLNRTAADVNDDATKAQKACANHGTHA